MVAKVLLAQVGVTLVLAMLFWGMDGRVSGYSALLGGLTFVIPNAFLALRLAASTRDPGARALVRAAYIGELGKLALTVLFSAWCSRWCSRLRRDRCSQASSRRSWRCLQASS